MGARNKGRDSSGHVDPYYQRRTRFQQALAPLGLEELFARVPRRLQEVFWKFKAPDPILEFDASLGDSAANRTMRREMERSFRAAAIAIEIGTEPCAGTGSKSMRVRDFLSVIFGCLRTVQEVGEKKMPPEMVEFVRVARPRLESFFDKHRDDAFRALLHAVRAPQLANSRLDTRLVTTTPSHVVNQKGRFTPRLTIGAIAPQERSVPLDGSPRPMYRVASLLGGTKNGVSWISWKSDQIGLDKSGKSSNATKEWPVFVQSHALRQLRDRVSLPEIRPYVEAWLAESLEAPRVVEQLRGNDLLIEFRVLEHRIGYLVCTVLADVVAVRTFKFLTMENTPEARLLNKELRLTRRDVDWLGLQELSAFTQTDLGSDPLLRPIMEKCGCGHLFELSEMSADEFAPQRKPQPKELAAEMKKYLRMAA